ncbi:hypothetical protein PG996_008335 [Apiospora saccharicola]|uniref:F-box domain-containing protein n=1 Tax=Apiospora saccharicola TaxID=335842 RepID=A0ABR1UXM5_9PEZI
MSGLMNLPLELLRSIQGFLITREDSFNMTYTCKDMHKALGSMKDLLQHDAVHQRAQAQMVWLGVAERHELMPDPLFAIVICNGSNIEIVAQAFDIYIRRFRECMDGAWGFAKYDPPAFMAAMRGRSDILNLFHQRGVSLQSRIVKREDWHELIICGEGLMEPIQGSLGDTLFRPSIDLMIQHLPGVLMFAMYGSADDLACLLVQHLDLYTQFCNQGNNVPMGVFGGLCYLAARCNMPKLLRYLLSWGVTIWAQRAGYTPTVWLTILYSAATEGTRHLPYPRA